MNDQDFDLKDLDNGELVEQIQDDLYDGLEDEVAEGVEILLERGIDANDVLGDALVGGMKIVGKDFRDGILFVPEVLKCAAAMKSGMVLLRPILANSSIDISLGKFVIGTVKGDIHDIGKNLVGMMLEGAESPVRLLLPQPILSSRAHQLQFERVPGLQQQVIQIVLHLDRMVQLPAELSSVSNTNRPNRAHAQLNITRCQPRESLVG